jgi:hypothetical protein
MPYASRLAFVLPQKFGDATDETTLREYAGQLADFISSRGASSILLAHPNEIATDGPKESWLEWWNQVGKIPTTERESFVKGLFNDYNVSANCIVIITMSFNWDFTADSPAPTAILALNCKSPPTPSNPIPRPPILLQYISHTHKRNVIQETARSFLPLRPHLFFPLKWQHFAHRRRRIRPRISLPCSFLPTPLLPHSSTRF